MIIKRYGVTAVHHDVGPTRHRLRERGGRFGAFVDLLGELAQLDRRCLLALRRCDLAEMHATASSALSKRPVAWTRPNVVVVRSGADSMSSPIHAVLPSAEAPTVIGSSGFDSSPKLTFASASVRKVGETTVELTETSSGRASATATAANAKTPIPNTAPTRMSEHTRAAGGSSFLGNRVSRRPENSYRPQARDAIAIGFAARSPIALASSLQ
jgi:hypothetical protein